MAKQLIDTPTKLKKIKPEPGFQRRNSTGNASMIFSEPTPIPNYLRASIGSCHDLCKHGRRRDVEAESEQDRKRKAKAEARSKTDGKGKRASGAKNSVPLSSRKQPSESKPLVREQSNEKSEMSRNDAGKGIRLLEASKKTSSSVKIDSAKIQRSNSSTKMVSQSKIKKSAEKSDTGERICSGDIPEKIMHVTEPNLNLDHQNVDHADQEGNRGSPSCLSPNQKQKMDSAAKSWNKAVRIGRVVMKDHGSSPRKQRIKMAKALGIVNGEAGPNGSSLRRVVHDGHSIHEDDESTTLAPRHQALGRVRTWPSSTSTVPARKLTRISRTKVKALVDSFETLVNIQYSKSSRAYSRSHIHVA